MAETIKSGWHVKASKQFHDRDPELRLWAGAGCIRVPLRQPDIEATKDEQNLLESFVSHLLSYVNAGGSLPLLRCLLNRMPDNQIIPKTWRFIEHFPVDCDDDVLAFWDLDPDPSIKDRYILWTPDSGPTRHSHEEYKALTRSLRYRRD